MREAEPLAANEASKGMSDLLQALKRELLIVPCTRNELCSWCPALAMNSAHGALH